MNFIHRIAFVSIFLLSAPCSFAQEPAELGNFTSDEIALKECSFDKGAEAVVLFDKATSNYNDEYNLITDRRIRFKILKEKGIARGNIQILVQSKNDFETVSRIRAVIGSPDGTGNLVYSKLEQKSIFKRRINDHYSEVTFAMPNVKVGSIIEYEYESRMNHYGGLQDWYFQSDIPVMLSAYRLYIVPTAEFRYIVRKSHFMHVTIEPDPKNGRVYFEMKNIPGLRDESYSTSYRDFLQRVDFQLSAVASRGTVTKYSTTWKEMTRELLEEKEFGSQLDKSFSIADQLKPLLTGTGNNFERMKLIHDYVRSNITWNYIDSKYAIDGLKRVAEKKQGTSGEMNLLMINLLRSADISAYPMLVSERAHGKVDTTYPLKDQFNKVVAYVDIEGKKYILDASDAYTPSGMTPIELLNTIGFVVDKKNQGFVRIGDEGKKKSYVINVRTTIEPAAQIKGEASVDLYDYARVSKAEKYKRNKESYIADFLKTTPDLRIDSFTVSNLESDSLSLNHHFVLNQSLNKSGSYYLLNYNLFTGFDKNPFVADYRFTNIDFGSRFTCVLNSSFQLPDNLVVESYPKNARIILPGNSLMVTRQLTQKGNEIKISVLIEFNTSEFEPDDYPAVKEFFKKMTEMLNEPVVLKSK